MDPTPFEIDLALIKALARATPGLNLRYLTRRQGWVLEAEDPAASLHEMAGLSDPSPKAIPFLLEELQSFSSSGNKFGIFSIPHCAAMARGNWPARPFHRLPEFASRHFLVHSAHEKFNLPTISTPSPIAVRKSTDLARLDRIIAMMAAQYYQDEPKHSLALQLLHSMTQAENVDFLEFVLRETGEIIGGMVVLHEEAFCYHIYGFLERSHQGKNYLHQLQLLFQEAALRKDTRYIIGETLHESMRPGLRRIYERLGGKFSYSRVYYGKNFFRFG